MKIILSHGEIVVSMDSSQLQPSQSTPDPGDHFEDTAWMLVTIRILFLNSIMIVPFENFTDQKLRKAYKMYLTKA
jgi:hypothetical protein